MMKCFTLILLLISINANGQFAIIDDKNGYTNVRKNKDPESDIVGRLYNEDVFLIDEYYVPRHPEDEWIEIYQNVFLDKIEPFKRDYYIKEFMHNKNDFFICHGYISKSRYVPLKNLEEIKTQTKFFPVKDRSSSLENDSILYFNDSINLLFVYGRFNPSEHKIQKHIDRSGHEIIDKIDDNPPIRGIFGNMPSSDIKNIKLTVKSELVEIPKQDYWDLFNPKMWNVSLRIDKRGTIYIYLFDNADGAAWYAAVWIINGYKYIKRYVDSPGWVLHQNFFSYFT